MKIKNKKMIIQGKFWIPGNKKEISGTLNIQDGGKIILTLNDLIQAPEKTEIIETIWGITENNLPISLFKSFSLQNYATQLVATIAVQTNQPFENLLHIHQVVLGNTLYNENEHVIKEGDFTLDLKCIRKMDLFLNNVQIETGWFLSIELKGEMLSCKLVFQNSDSIKLFLEKIKLIQDFFCFIADEKINIKEISCRDKMNQEFILIQESIIFDSSDKSKHSGFLEIWQLMEPENVLKNWFELFGKKKLALGLFLSTITNPPKFLTPKFLLLAQALESFHRTSHFEQKRMANKELKNLKKYIRSSMRDTKWDKYVTIVDEYLGHIDEISFKTRLENLFSTICIVFSTEEEKNELITKIVKYRNKYTHVVHLDDDQDILYELTLKLDALLSVLILNEIFESLEAQKYYKYDRVTFGLKGGFTDF